LRAISWVREATVASFRRHAPSLPKEGPGSAGEPTKVVTYAEAIHRRKFTIVSRQSAGMGGDPVDQVSQAKREQAAVQIPRGHSKTQSACGGSASDPQTAALRGSNQKGPQALPGIRYRLFKDKQLVSRKVGKRYLTTRALVLKFLGNATAGATDNQTSDADQFEDAVRHGDRNKQAKLYSEYR
jgi:hypothetical protein